MDSKPEHIVLTKKDIRRLYENRPSFKKVFVNALVQTENNGHSIVGEEDGTLSIYATSRTVAELQKALVDDGWTLKEVN